MSVTTFLVLLMVATWTVWALFSIVHAAYTDKFLRKYKDFNMFVCSLLLYTFCASNASSVGIFRKPKDDDSGETVDNTSETETELEDEAATEILSIRSEGSIRKKAILSNFIAFGYYNSTYSVIANLGAVVLATSTMFLILVLTRWSHQELRYDLLISALHLSIPGVLLLLSVFIVANVNDLYKRDKECFKYDPFDEVIHVPMSVIAGAAISAFKKSGFRYPIRIITGFFFLTIGPNILYVFSENDLEKDHPTYTEFRLKKLLWVVRVVMVFGSVVGPFVIGYAFLHFYRLAVQNLLATMEQNWQRNLVAIEFILRDHNIRDLEDLRSRLITKKEENIASNIPAFHYLALPLWKPKRPFVELRN